MDAVTAVSQQLHQLNKELEELSKDLRDAEQHQLRAMEGGNDSVKAHWDAKVQRLVTERMGLLKSRQDLEQQLTGAAPLDVIAAFKAKLAALGINRPSPDAMLRVSTYYASRLLVAAAASSPPEEARALYQSALALPGHTSRACIQEQLHISLNGPWLDQHPYLLSGVDTESDKPVVVKMLPTHEVHLSKAAAAEQHAVNVLQLDRQLNVPLLPTQLVMVQVAHADMQQLGIAAGQRAALVMPMLCSSLAALPQLSPEHILKGGKRMQQALTYMHSKGIVHMDVKVANILMDSNGDWFLSDFGSSTPIGEPVWSYTQGWYPCDIRRHQAAPKHDWGMLVVTLAVLLDKENLGALKADGDSSSFVLQRVQERCRTAQYPALSKLLQELLGLAEWQ